MFFTSPAPKRAGFATSEKRPPLGLGYLMAVLEKAGHTVLFSDEYLSPSTWLDDGRLEKEQPEWVGIYSNTICFGGTLKLLEKLQRMREHGTWRGKLLVGGPHTSVGADSIPDYVDHIVQGEAEITLSKILDGTVGERIITGERVEDLDALPRPAWHHFTALPYDWTHRWYDTQPLYTANTSRGCPFNCTFCSVKAIWGKTYRAMSAERVVDDVEYMIREHGARGIYFREDHFTLDKKRVVAFCDLMLKKDIRMDWFCETRVDRLDDPEYVRLMARAGCRVFYIGVESGSPRMLEFYRKGETRDQFVTAFRLAREAGIGTYASIITGFPTETDEDRAQTESLLEQIKPDHTGYNVYLGIPGSELYDYVRENGLYEYEDEFHILYPNGYLDNIEKYYDNRKYFRVYDRQGRNWREFPRRQRGLKGFFRRLFR